VRPYGSTHAREDAVHLGYFGLMGYRQRGKPPH
jgi:hypothetical protein